MLFLSHYVTYSLFMCGHQVRLALLAEFGDCAKASQFNPCNKLLADNQVKEEEIGLYWAILWTLFVAFRLGGLALLRKKASKFY